MTKENQKELLKNFAQSFVDEFNIKIKHVPENWDGNELRCWLADTINDAVRSTEIRRNPKSQRAKDYMKVMTVSNL